MVRNSTSGRIAREVRPTQVNCHGSVGAVGPHRRPARAFSLLLALSLAASPLFTEATPSSPSRPNNPPLIQGRDPRSLQIGGNVLSLNAKIGKQDLLNGETTWVSILVEGAEGIENDICLRLRNNSPTVIRFAGPSSTLFPADELNRGRVTFRTTIQGIRAGRFNITTDLTECGTRDYQAVLKEYEDALSEARTAKRRDTEATLLRGMGLAYERLGQLTEASARYGEALAIIRDLGMGAREADTSNRLGGVLVQMGRPQEASGHFQQSLKLARELGIPLWVWKSREGLGDVHAAQAEPRQAIAEYQSAVENIEEAGSDFDGTRRLVYEKLVAMLGRQNQLNEALQYIQRFRTQAVRGSVRKEDLSVGSAALQESVLRSASLEEQRAAAWETLRDEHSKPKNEQDRTLIQAATKQLASTEQELNETLTRIKQQDPSFASLVRVDPSLWVDAQQLLPPEVALVEYFPTDKSLLIFTVTSQGRPVLKQVAVTRQALEEIVARYLREIFARAEIAETSKSLYRLLVEPVEKEIETASLVALMPAGALFYVPFASLAHTAPDGRLRFLIEDKSLVHLTDLAAWRLMRQNNEAAPAGPSLLVAFANPGGDLPAAEAEVNAIAQQYARKEVYLRDQASKMRVQNIRSDCTVLHFATHGVLNGDLLTASYLKLAGDDQLTQGEVYGLGLRQKRTRLVILSACETAVGARRPGLEFLGLADAFSKAGASAVIGTLWRVADQSTAQLMSAFHAGLTDPRKRPTKAQVLREAQLHLLHSAAYRHPFYWSPFVLVGDWR